MLLLTGFPRRIAASRHLLIFSVPPCLCVYTSMDYTENVPLIGTMSKSGLEPAYPKDQRTFEREMDDRSDREKRDSP